MSDSIKALTKRICAFRDEREWSAFHSPKDLSFAISAEAGELMQHFVWQSGSQSVQRVAERRGLIAEELADIAILLFEMASVSEIDLGTAIDAKLAANAAKYPVEKARGSNKKYNEL
jgi:NTP pyrophosphatase (non-canonical NTP hydrolase)